MLIVHGLVATFDERGTLLGDGAIKITGDRIVEIGPTNELQARYASDEQVNAQGMLVMPGLICGHTHFYSAFSRGMPPRGTEPPADFPHILEQLWWRLDLALQPEDIQASTEVSLADAIRHGTTTLVDHHSSPNAIAGSLDVIAESVVSAGVRACLSYEVSDRNGPDGVKEGIRENTRFIKRCQTERNPQLAGLMGLHASMTLSETTLDKAVWSAQDLGVGYHIHVAEDKADVADSLKKYGVRVVERLRKAGILTSQTIAAHAIHVDDYELEHLRQSGTHVIHNPRSNMNNAVGTARVPRMLHDGVRVGLGNDGFSNNMFTEMSTAYLLHKSATGDPRVLPADHVIRMAFTNNRMATLDFFPAEVGILAPGAMADVIIVDYRAPTPVTPENLPGHIIFGIDGTSVRSTICGGKFLMRDRQLLTMNEDAIAARARQLALKVWARY